MHNALHELTATKTPPDITRLNVLNALLNGTRIKMYTRYAKFQSSRKVNSVTCMENLLSVVVWLYMLGLQCWLTQVAAPVGHTHCAVLGGRGCRS